jgi:hypothetical protein
VTGFKAEHAERCGAEHEMLPFEGRRADPARGQNAELVPRSVPLSDTASRSTSSLVHRFDAAALRIGTACHDRSPFCIGRTAVSSARIVASRRWCRTAPLK